MPFESLDVRRFYLFSCRQCAAGDSLKDARRMKKHRTKAAIALAMGMLTLAGCGSGNGLDTVPIKGEVTYNGKPLTEGTVAYLPVKPGTGRSANGPIGPDGTFSMTTQQRDDGVVKGEYNIVIYAYAPHPGEPQTREEHEAMAKAGGIKRGYVIPEKYVMPETSGLADTVDENHSGFKKIELKD